MGAEYRGSATNAKLLASRVEVLGEKLDALTGNLVELGKTVLELKRSVTEASIRKLVEDVVEMRSEEIRHLTGSAAKALRLMVDRGLVSQEEVNATMQG
jgi:vacuolar-type H+-ATPase subunit D/Vma8